MSQKRSLTQWLSYIEHAHSISIDMSLTRIRKVFVLLEAMINERQQALPDSIKPKCVVTVAGTNGKGTTCRFIEQACVKAGYSAGVYASPHITHFNERIRINAVEASDAQICEAFDVVEQARISASKESQLSGEPEISLSYFEYATLCGFAQFMLSKLDVWIVEVGLGGRLDATNIIDANIGVITSIGLDHQSYLGDTTELIAAEKAGIIKPQQNVIIGYPAPHKSLLKIAEQQNATLKICGIDFGLSEGLASATSESDSGLSIARPNLGWIRSSEQVFELELGKAQLPKQNIMTAIACLCEIAIHLNNQENFLLSVDELQELIDTVQMPGRFQILQESPKIVVDVAHNEAACEYLLKRLQTISFSRCHIVVGMLKDKNIEASLACLAELNANWYCVSLGAQISAQRGENAQRLQKAIMDFGQTASCFDNVAQGMQSAMNKAQPNDIIVVVGSFIVASECMRFMSSKNKGEIE